MTSSEPFDLPTRVADLEESLDQMWLVVSGAQVLLMQLGFAFLEGGCVRYKNMQSIMSKVFSNAAISILMSWLIGYAFMFGQNDPNKFIGTTFFAAQGFDKEPWHYSHFVLQAAVGAAANSIVSGGAVERMSFVGYMVLSVFFSGWIYPVCIHWAFGEGWLMEQGYWDFAGSGAIHLTGAMGALTTTVMLGPRKNRFNHEFEAEFQACNTTYITLATLTLYFCWMFFNAGSTLAISGHGAYIIATAGMNTMLAGASGGLTVFLIHYFRNMGTTSRYSLIMICNGNLAGLVAVTGYSMQLEERPCDNIEAWAAVVIGVLGGVTYSLVAKFIEWLRIDDPVDAIPIHGGCGALGAIMVGFFNRDTGLVYGFGGKQLGTQILGVIVFSAWSVVMHLLVLYALKYLDILRVSDIVEAKGLDNTIAGGPAFVYEPIYSIEMENHHSNHSFATKEVHH